MAIKIVGSGEPLLFLHSSLSSHRQWASLHAQLASLQRFCLVSVDLSGYGDEPCPKAPRPFSLAAEVERLLERLPADLLEQPWSLVGHSYGGAVALQLALSGRVQVQQLALFEPVAFHLLDRDSALWREVATLADELCHLPPMHAAARFIDYWQESGYFAALPSKMQQGLAAQVLKVSLDFEALAQAPWTLADYQQRLQMPVWLGSGVSSRDSAKRIVQLLASSLAKAQLHTFACGHMGPVTDAALVNLALLEFLTVGA